MVGLVYCDTIVEKVVGCEVVTSTVSRTALKRPVLCIKLGSLRYRGYGLYSWYFVEVFDT